MVQYCFDLYAMGRAYREQSRANVFALVYAAPKYSYDWIIGILTTSAGRRCRPSTKSFAKTMNKAPERQAKSKTDYGKGRVEEMKKQLSLNIADLQSKVLLMLVDLIGM